MNEWKWVKDIQRETSAWNETEALTESMSM